MIWVAVFLWGVIISIAFLVLISFAEAVLEISSLFKKVYVFVKNIKNR